MGELLVVLVINSKGEEFTLDKQEARKTLGDDYLKGKLISIKRQDKHFRENYKFYC